MYNEIDFLVKKAALEDMKQEAHRSRLVREAFESSRVYHPEEPSAWKFYCLFLVRVGRWLEQTGYRLQNRYGQPLEKGLISPWE